MSTSPNGSYLRAPVAVLLAWLIPGLGHIYLGQRLRGMILLVTITLTFWTGVAIGGVKSVTLYTPAYTQETLNQWQQEVRKGERPPVQLQITRSWWFIAQLMNGAYTLGSYHYGRSVADFNPTSGRTRVLAWPSGEVGSIYTGIAGLLNLLVILDALAYAEGLPGLRKRFTSQPVPAGIRSGP
ncbi:MAG: hypothetical protein HJJLKODD_01189 [Phycisphaerae bacterium]|nr:hypothetical protein [Phycisphaerae bacterium]